MPPTHAMAFGKKKEVAAVKGHGSAIKSTNLKLLVRDAMKEL